MGRPGRKRRLVLEDEYWKLMASGLGTGETCRRLGGRAFQALANCTRECRSSLANIDLRWVLTVCTDTYSASATARLVRP